MLGKRRHFLIRKKLYKLNNIQLQNALKIFTEKKVQR
jgi:hypothetical protein